MLQKNLIEASVLDGLQRGSYEDIMTILDVAVSENSEIFGDNASLLATYPDRVVVVNEAEQFLSAKYVIGDGRVVSFKKPEIMDVKTVSEGDVISRGVQDFLDGKSLREGLNSLVGLIGDNPVSALAEMSNKLKNLFSGGGLWRKGLQRNEATMAGFAWDADYGTLDINTDPVFSFIYQGDKEIDLEQHREDVMEGLLALEGRIMGMLNMVSEAWDGYRHNVSIVRDVESDSTLAQFDAFAEDYLSHLSDVGTAVSEAVRDVGAGCVQCSALVHDEVVRRMMELELGGRFIRKVSASFTK